VGTIDRTGIRGRGAEARGASDPGCTTAGGMGADDCFPACPAGSGRTLTRRGAGLKALVPGTRLGNFPPAWGRSG